MVQDGDLKLHYQKLAEGWENKLKKNEEHLMKLESEKKKKEQYEGELGVVLWNSVNTMPYQHTVCAQCVAMVSTLVYGNSYVSIQYSYKFRPKQTLLHCLMKFY